MPELIGSPQEIRLNIEISMSLDKRLCALIDRFSLGGAQGCTKHAHTFFGPLTPEEWARLMYKHLDHHLRQFGV